MPLRYVAKAPNPLISRRAAIGKTGTIKNVLTILSVAKLTVPLYTPENRNGRAVRSFDLAESAIPVEKYTPITKVARAPRILIIPPGRVNLASIRPLPKIITKARTS